LIDGENKSPSEMRISGGLRRMRGVRPLRSPRQAQSQLIPEPADPPSEAPDAFGTSRIGAETPRPSAGVYGEVPPKYLPLNLTDISLDDPLPEGLDTEDDGRPHWLWALVRQGPRPHVWVKYPAEEAPPGCTVRSASAPKPGASGVVVMASPPASSPTHADTSITPITTTEVDPASVPTKGRPKTGRSTRPSDLTEPHDNAFIDQKSPFVVKDTYLRLARKKAFPSKKIGKRISARWADVKAAFAAPTAAPAPQESTSDEIDAIRAKWGLAAKGGS
jgi:hypothetical protein